MIKNMRIKNKLLISFVIVAILASIAGIYSVTYTGKVNSEYTYAMQNYGFAQGDVGKLLSCFGSINVSVHDAVSFMDEAKQADATEEFNSQLAKMDDYFDSLEATIIKEETKAAFDQAKDAWTAYLPLAKELMQEGTHADTATVLQVQERIAQELDPLYDTIYDSLAQVMFTKVDEGAAVEEKLSAGIDRSRIFVVLIIVASLAVSLVFGTFISKGIADPIRKCAKRLSDLSNGDLHSPVPQFESKDEIGVLSQATNEIVSGLITIIEDEKYLLAEMASGNFDIKSKATEHYVGDFQEVIGAIRLINSHLSDTLVRINQGSDQVSSGSEQVSAAATNLSQGASEQATAIEGLARTIENISEKVRNNAENAEIASDKAHQVGDGMKSSNQKMQQMVGAMQEITESSNEIGKIIKTIEDIAFQTNILALNAAVEAARAGAAGKGFAVVAEEVRNLASKSAEASKNTAQLIEASIRAVENGTKIADETAESMVFAVEGAAEVVDVVEKISNASAEQSQAIEIITQNVEQISGVVQTNSATAEESAAASEELSTQAQILRDLVSQFKLIEHEAASYA